MYSCLLNQLLPFPTAEPPAGKRVLRGSRGHFELFIPSHSRGNTESDKRDLIKKYAPSPEVRPFKTWTLRKEFTTCEISDEGLEQ